MELLSGVRFDNPPYFLSWDTDERTFLNAYKEGDIKLVVEHGYFLPSVTIFGEPQCNIGIEFYSNGVRKVGISRGNYAEIDCIESFDKFQKVLIRVYGKPTITN